MEDTCQRDAGSEWVIQNYCNTYPFGCFVTYGEIIEFIFQKKQSDSDPHEEI